MIGILQVLKFSFFAILVLFNVRIFIPQEVQANDTANDVAVMFAHNDGCSAVIVILLGAVSISTESARVLYTVEWIQIVYFAILNANMLREKVNQDVLNYGIFPILLLAHGWTFWKVNQVLSSSTEDVKIQSLRSSPSNSQPYAEIA